MRSLEKLGFVCIGLFTQDPKHLLRYFQLDLEQFTLRNIGITVITLGTYGLSLLAFGNINLFISIPIIGCLLFLGLMNWYSVKYSRIMGLIEEHADLIYNELATVKIYSNSIIDAITFIAAGQYPILSKETKSILHKVQLGASPEQEIRSLLLKFPSPLLLEGWGLFLDQKEVNERNLQVNQELAQQVSLNRFEEQTSQLETRLMLFVGLSLFIIPIYQILSAMLEWSLITGFITVPLGMFLFILEIGLFNRLSIVRLTSQTKNQISVKRKLEGFR